MAYEPHQCLSIAWSTTVGPKARGGSTARTVVERITGRLAPNHPLAG
ncbi:hypothetical protein [Streptomyces sp. HUAS ZL42]